MASALSLQDSLQPENHLPPPPPWDTRGLDSVSPVRDFSPLLLTGRSDEASLRSSSTEGGLRSATPDQIELTKTAAEIEELLKGQLVILSGGRDKEGQSILTVPSKPRDFYYKKEDLQKVLQYLTSLPRDEVRKCGYSLVIDGHTSTWSNIKNLLHMFQEYLLDQIHVAYIIRPGTFLEKRKTSMKLTKENTKLQFTTITVSSKDKLSEHISNSQITSDLGGFLPYSHSEWIKLRKDLEEFIQSYNSLMQHYWSLERDIVAEVMANEVEGIERLLSHHTSVLQEIKAAPKYVHKTGTDLLISIEKDQEKGGVSSMTPEKINATAVIRNILDRVARKEHQLEDVWRHKKVLLDQNLQYRVFDNAVAKISSWLKGKGLEMVADRQEVGVCVQTSQEILRHLKGMEAKSKGVGENVTKLRMMADRMCGANHFASENLQHNIAKLTSKWAHHVEMVSQRKLILGVAISFYQTIERFNGSCATLTSELQSQQDIIEEQSNVSEFTADLGRKLELLQDLWVRAQDTCKNLETEMAAAMDVVPPQPDYREGIVYVRKVCESAREKMTTFSHLVEAKRTSLDQSLQIFKCEQDVQQVISWLKDLLQQMISSQGDLGESLEAVMQLKNDHRKFSETAKKTYLGGRDLLSVALKNRQQQSLPTMDNQQLGLSLKDVWEMVNQGVEEREKRLEMAKIFHQKTESILSLTDQMSHSNEAPPLSTEEVRRELDGISATRDSFREEIQQTMGLGNEMLERISAPLVAKQPKKEPNEAARLCMELIRSKIVRLKTIIADVDKLVQLRRKNLQDALLFRSLEEKLAEIKSWCSNEGRLQPASFIHKDMTFEELKEFKDKQQQAIEVKEDEVVSLQQEVKASSATNRYRDQMVAMATELEETWTNYQSETKSAFEICEKYMSFWRLSQQIHSSKDQLLRSRPSSQEGAAVSASSMQKLQALKDGYIAMTTRATRDGNVVIEHLRGSTTGASVCREIELELQAIQQNTDQLDSGWKNMETTIKQSLQLNQYRDELKTMMNTLRELEEKRLRIIDFGNSRQSFETYENTFEQLDQRATTVLRRSEEVKALLHRLVMMGVAVDDEDVYERMLIDFSNQWTRTNQALDRAKMGFEVAVELVTLAGKVCHETSVVKQMSSGGDETRLSKLVEMTQSFLLKYKNWLSSVKSFSIGNRLHGVLEEVQHATNDIVSNKLQRDVEQQKLQQLEQDVEKHTEWLESRVRQFLEVNNELGDTGDVAKEVKRNYTNFVTSVQPSFNELNRLDETCQGLISNAMIGHLVSEHKIRLKTCHDICSKSLHERLDIITAFVDFKTLAGKLSSCIGRLDRHAEDIPVIRESVRDSGDVLQHGQTAMKEMEDHWRQMEAAADSYLKLAGCSMLTVLGPPLHLKEATVRLTDELSILKDEARDTKKRWLHAEEELQRFINLTDFNSNYNQIMGWIEQHGRPFLLHDVGMSASEIEEMKMELLEFLLKVKRIEGEVSNTVALGNDIVMQSGGHHREVSKKILNLESELARLTQLMNLRQKVLEKTASFFQQFKKAANEISQLSDNIEPDVRKRISKDIHHLDTVVDGIITMATELSQSDQPPIGQCLLNLTLQLKKQLDEGEAYGLGLLSPEESSVHQPLGVESKPPPTPPRRKDSLKKYASFVSRRTSGAEEVDMGKKVVLRSITKITQEVKENEEVYTHCLQLIVDHYLKELRESKHRPDFLVKSRDAIFGNIEDIYKLHTQLLDSLRKAQTTEEFCKAFIQLEAEFQAYVPYLKTVSHGWRTLNSFGGNFFDTVKKECRLGYTLINCYNRTFTKLAEFCKCFNELLPATQKEDLYSVHSVQKALVMMSKLYNKCVREVAFGNLRGLTEHYSEEGLLLVDDFQVVIVRKKKKVPHYFTVFLHTDSVIFAKSESVDEIHPPTYHKQEELKCSKILLTENYQSTDRFALTYGSQSGTVYIFQSVRKEEILHVKDIWTTAIKGMQLEFFEKLKAQQTGGKKQDLPEPIVHSINVPEKTATRISRRSRGSYQSHMIQSSGSRESLMSQRFPTNPQLSEGSERASSIVVVQSPHLQSAVSTTQEEEEAMEDVYQVYKPYRLPNPKDTVLPIGQLVEVLDDSGMNWLVSTIADNSEEESMEVFVPKLCLRKYTKGGAERPVSMVSQYSMSTQPSVVEPQRTSMYKEEPEEHVYDVIQQQPKPPSATPSKGVPSLPIALPQPYEEENSKWYLTEDYTSNDGVFMAGEAVEVLDDSGPVWYVSTIEDPREGFLPPQILSQTSPRPVMQTQPSVIEVTTPVATPPVPIATQSSVIEVPTSTHESNIEVKTPTSENVPFEVTVREEDLKITETVSSPTTQPSVGATLSFPPKEVVIETNIVTQPSVAEVHVTPSPPPTVARPQSPKKPPSPVTAGTESKNNEEPKAIEKRTMPNVMLSELKKQISKSTPRYDKTPSVEAVTPSVQPEPQGAFQDQSRNSPLRITGGSPRMTMMALPAPTSRPASSERRSPSEGRSPDQPLRQSSTGRQSSRERTPEASQASSRPFSSSVDEDPLPNDKPMFYEALGDFVPNPGENSIPLAVGQVVQVQQKANDLWWLVVPMSGEGIEGWVPANFLKPLANEVPQQNADEPAENHQLEVTKEPKPKLFTAIAHVMARNPNELSLQLAEEVEVLDDNRDDWWLVRTLPSDKTPSVQGWVPCAALSPASPPESQKPAESAAAERYIAIATFYAQDSIQLTITENQMIEVVNDSRDDWTLVRTVGQSPEAEGWVPKSFIRKYTEDQTDVGSTCSSDVLETDDILLEGPLHPNSNVPASELLSYSINELVKSEKEYLYRLRFAVDGYVPAVFNDLAPKTLKPQRHVLLGNLENITDFHINSFLPSLEEARDCLDAIGEVFLNHSKMFRDNYITFCLNKRKSDDVYADHRQHMIEVMQRLQHRLELSNYLILPIQRITKYALILKDILKYAQEVHLSSVVLENALGMIQDVSNKANNSIHYAELESDAKRMLPLDTLQLQHIFPVKCEGVWKERRVFLFQSQLAITKPCLDAVATNHLVIRKVLKLNRISMAPGDLEENDTSIVMYDLNQGSKVILQTPTVDTKQTWSSNISRYIEICNTQPKPVQKTASDTSVVSGLSVKRVSSLSLKRSFKMRSVERRQKREESAQAGCKKSRSVDSLAAPPIGSHLVVLEPIVLEDADDTTLDTGEVVKLVNVISLSHYRVETSQGEEGIVPVEYVRKVDSEKSEVPPKILQGMMASLVVSFGRTILLSCYFTGIPHPSVTWSKEEQVLTKDSCRDIYVGPNSTFLEIQKASYNDTGEYKCVLTNPVGSADSVAMVTVEGPPLPPGQPICMKVSNTYLKLKWNTSLQSGGAEVTYRLEQQHRGLPRWQPIIEVTKPAVTLHDLEPNMEYRYRVIGYNRFGASTPGPASDPIMTKDPSRNNLKAMANFFAPSPLTGRKITSSDSLSVPHSPSLQRAVSPPPNPAPPPHFIKTKPINSEYTILYNHFLGVGQFSKVYQSVSKQTNVVYAAKQLQLPTDKGKVVQYREASILKGLKHSNIIEFQDAFDVGPSIVIVMELADGGSLFPYLTSLAYFTESVCAYYIQQLLKAFEYLAEKNIAHLDVKPENLHLSSSRNGPPILKLIDFGSARDISKDSIAGSGGTPEFLAPEVLNSSPVTQVTDMWSVGVITYILLSGLSPFFVGTLNETIVRVQDARYSFPNEAFGHISEDAKLFISSLLQVSEKFRLTASKALNHSWILMQAEAPGRQMCLDVVQLKAFVDRRNRQERRLSRSLAQICDIDGDSVFSAYSLGVVNPPLNVRVTPITDDTIVISWKYPINSKGCHYRVEQRCLQPDQNNWMILEDRVTDSQISLKYHGNVAASYTYRVACVNKQGLCSYSNPITF